MFNQYVYGVVDTIQTSQKSVIDFIQHKELKSTLNSFVDAQTKLSKDAIKISTDFTTKVSEIVADRTNFIEFQKNFEKFFPTNLATAKSKKAE